MNLKQSLFTFISAAIIAAPLQAQNAPRAPRTPRTATIYTTIPGGRSYLGVDITDISSDRVSALKLKEERGVEIVSVDQDAPAAKAGLKEHDVILEFNGEKVDSEEQLRRMLREMPPGRMVKLGISRDGQPMTIAVQLADRKKMMVVAPGANAWAFEVPEIPPMPEVHVPEMNIPAFEYSGMSRSYSISAGLMVESLTPQLGDFFGVKNGEGVLVRSVEKGSAAAASGLKAGDVIVKFDGRKIADQTDWRSALRSRKSGKVTLNVIRDKREQTLSLNLPEPKRASDASWLELPSLEDFDNEMAEMTIAWNRNQPEMQKALQQSRSDMQHALELYRKEWNAHRGEMQKALEELSKIMGDLKDKN